MGNYIFAVAAVVAVAAISIFSNTNEGIHSGKTRLSYEPLVECPDNFGAELIDGRSELLGTANRLQECMQLVSARSKSNKVLWDDTSHECFAVINNTKVKKNNFSSCKICELNQPYPRPKYLWEFSNVVNIAITGTSGVGKSTFINTIRHLTPMDDDAAGVSVNEGTMKPTPYKYSLNGLDVVFWDLPGAGTKSFPSHTYVRKMGLRYFDVVLLLNAHRFLQTDKLLAKELANGYVPYYFVKTKANLDFAENKRDYNKSAEETKMEILNDLKKNGIDNAYFVGKYYKDETDPFEHHYDY
eukprot:18631_1